MRVRVYQPASGPARIVRPNPKLRRPDESEDAFVARIAALTEARDPTLAGLPSATIDEADLPAERQEREHWRLVAGRVAVRRPEPTA